ncbi:MAG: DNA-protecting protein DprA [Maricaulis sp.]|uniref:DNA-processing protein DprA n=1 Tax=Maricaulis sp. TaxID=1486257 RepID=UPI001B2D22E0|nr:DNA-processing protein DprA [Maricaulis sp.]MBO6847285.1 DNA-protecting protein DprA [Maricaulis sp.]MBO6876516.1 DNA-protecting protein DprA [Maricaulis sp.]
MSQQPLDDRNRIAALRLARTPRLGPATYLKLLRRFGSPADALNALPDLVRQKRLRPFSTPSEGAAETELEALACSGDALYLLGDSDYPEALSLIPDPPIALIARGRCDLLERPACAIVGSRNASAAGARQARDLARALASHDVVTVSGLARGIDGAAHRGALETGTIAAVAGGADIIYPPEHAELQQAIAEQGLVISEQALGTRPVARDFPRRNRIISGLSLATLVVEAALQSGSLITARLAGEQGREVMALPGSPLDPRARGTNRLLRDGAHLVETADDILDILKSCRLTPQGLSEQDQGALFPGPDDDAPEFDLPDPLAHDSADGAGLQAMLSMAPVSVDELARQTGRPLGEVQAELLELELQGEIAVTAGGLVQRNADG